MHKCARWLRAHAGQPDGCPDTARRRRKISDLVRYFSNSNSENGAPEGGESARAGSGGAPEGGFSAALQKQQPKRVSAPTHGGYKWFANLQRNSRARAEKRLKDVDADQKKKGAQKELEKHEAKKNKLVKEAEQKKEKKKKKKKRRNSSADDQDGEGKQDEQGDLQPPTKKAKADGQDHVRHVNAMAQHDGNAPLLLRMPSQEYRTGLRPVHCLGGGPHY